MNTLPLEILTTSQLQELSTQVDFTEALNVYVQTADVQQIDNVAAHAAFCIKELACEYPETFSTFDFHSIKHHPQMPERYRSVIKPALWEAHDEEVQLQVYGVRLSEVDLLFFTDKSGKHHQLQHSMRGINRTQDIQEAKLLGKRSLKFAIDTLSQITKASLLDAIAVHLHQELEVATPEASRMHTPKSSL